MAAEKVRLGGMALANGVLVHGPQSWACAIRAEDGRIQVAAQRKRFSGAQIESPLLRGPARLLDAMALIPQIRRALPEAKLPFQRPAVVAAMFGSATVVKLLRGSPNVGPAAQELLSGLLSVAPAALALRGSDVAAYHGAEHISIGSYEHGERREKEHERCGSHLLAPLLATTALGNALAARAPVHIRTPVRLGAQLVALAASTEIFGWMVRNPEKRLARALAKPGHQLQHSLATTEPWETVMTIEGDYTLFAHLETVYLGTLARRTLITTNVVRVLEAANRKPIIFMPARHDHHRVQTGDGYAAYVAGQVVGAEIGVTSDAQASWWGGRGVGTVPHALIASYGGNTVLAATRFAEWAPPELNITVLVDFENDSVATALEVARALGPRLWGVRLDTSGQLVDRSLWHELGEFDPRGVNEQLVRKVRDALDSNGFERVKIVVSGGFTIEKIRQFEAGGVPVDAYGIGSSLIRGSNDFTADIVLTDGLPSAKVGRTYKPNPRLELVT